MPSGDFEAAGYRPSADMYPGTPPAVRTAQPKVDNFIHRHVTRIIASRGPSESTANPNSAVHRNAMELFDQLIDIGVDLQRIRIGSAIAQMDIGNQIVNLWKSAPEDFDA